jgi:2-(1,2-epoxy-1,2-dihydrophenyl)acetyl-CoA isomerase
MDESPVLVEKRPGYHVVTLNRPQRLNAFNDDMHHALQAALDAAKADESCRALLLTGQGRAFSAGQDLADRVARPGQTIVLGVALEKFYNPLIRRLRALPFPVVAAVNGIAAGAGANVALACDIVLAGQSASFLQAFSRIGLVPDSGGSFFLPRLVGRARARGLALLAEPLPAETAASWGMIWKCVADDELMGAAHAMCARFAAGPTYGYSLVKRALDASELNDLATQLDLERDLQRAAGFSPDYTEGVSAFMEKRKPHFTGKKGKENG